MRTEWGPGDVQAIGGIEAWEQNCFGYCLMRGDELLCESTVGPAALGLYEPGVITQEAHRGKGYATITAARLIQEIETMGYKTYWNCAKQNVPSAKVARKLGYQVEKEYRCMAWSQL
jgi:RimJ/RimL family protein N-acetyltransferase